MANPKKKVSKTNEALVAQELQAAERSSEFQKLRTEITQTPANPIEAKLDRIIELLEGTLTMKQKGADFSANPWWNRFLDK